MLNQVIPAYLYAQYQQDGDLAAFISAYNEAAQYYLDWFSSINLAYYPGLSGDLLDWIADGVYGMQRTSLASPTTPAQGPLNTIALNTEPLNYFVPPVSTSYALTDDAFQRILTWNFYKGDGKRFSMRWIKRRIMRFLLGVNGTDPLYGTPGFVIGCENTQAISVTVASNVLTVAIDQVLLSSLVQITPGILQILQLAFQAGQAGPLELPAQYESYVFNIVTTLTVTALPTSLSAAGTATTQTTPSTAFTVLGGSGSYTYSTAMQAGSASELSVTSPTADATTVGATGMTAGNTYTGSLKCTVTDTITTNTASVIVPVSVTCYGAPSASVAPSSLSVTGATSTLTTASCTVTVTNGSGSYSYSWSMLGSSGITETSGNTATTGFQATGLTAGENLSDTGKCTVTDLVTGLQTTVTIPVTIDRASAVTVTASPASASSSGTATTQTTNSVTATGHGGSGAYSLSWTIVSGPFSIGSPSAPTTNFTCSGMTAGNTYTGTARCTATDGYGQTGYVDVPLSVSCSVGNYTGTMVAGSYYNPATSDLYLGYWPAVSIGSLSPATDLHGHTIEDIFYDTGAATLEIDIGGFSSDPGQSYFSQLQSNSNSWNTSAATYGYSGGIATWTWSVGSAPFSSGSSYSIVINY